MKFFRVTSATEGELIVAESDINGREVVGPFDHPAYAEASPASPTPAPIGLPAGLMRVKNPDKPGESLVLAQRDFNPAIHEAFDAPASALSTPVPPAPPVITPESKPTDDTTQQQTATQVDPALASVLDGPAKEVIGKIIVDVPVVELPALRVLEEQGRARKTVLGAIDVKLNPDA